jgi:hypothetical protein
VPTLIEYKADIFDALRCEAFERFTSQQVSTGKEELDPRKRMRALGQEYANFAEQYTNEFGLMRVS